MVNQEKLKQLTKEELLLYNELIEEDIKEVAYYACLLKHDDTVVRDLEWKRYKENAELKRKLHRFIGSGY